MFTLVSAGEVIPPPNKARVCVDAPPPPLNPNVKLPKLTALPPDEMICVSIIF